MNWKKKQSIGLSVQSMQEFRRAIFLGFDHVEIKLGAFADHNEHLYAYDNKIFKYGERMLKEIVSLAKRHGVSVQFHLPLAYGPTLNREKGIHMGLKEHHDVALARFIFLERIYRQYGIGSIITEHLPLILYKGRRILNEEEIIDNTRIFVQKLDEVRKREGHITRIGFENCGDVKFNGILGFSPEHFEKIFGSTQTLGMTFDIGHTRLAKSLKRREILGLGIPIVNFHFHGNSGVFDPKSFNDDEHLLPTRDNVDDYDELINYFRRHKTPVTLELLNLGRYKDEELLEFTKNLRQELK